MAETTCGSVGELAVAGRNANHAPESRCGGRNADWRQRELNRVCGGQMGGIGRERKNGALIIVCFGQRISSRVTVVVAISFAPIPTLYLSLRAALHIFAPLHLSPLLSTPQVPEGRRRHNPLLILPGSVLP